MKIKYWDESATADIETISEIRSIKLGRFHDCSIYGIDLHYPHPLIESRGELLLPTIEKFMSLGRGTVYESDMQWDQEQVTINNREDNPVFYFVYNMANYFHWIYDTVPYLYSYFLEKKNIKNLKLLVSPPAGQEDLYPFVYETLQLLGITKDDLIFLDSNTKYSTMLIGSSLTHNRMSLDPPHRGMFQVLESIKGTPSDKEKIYISRRTSTQNESNNIGTDFTKQRAFVNEGEVVELFKDYGFEEVFCESLSMKEKIGLFQSVKFVAGPIGGGLSNVIFCSPKTRVLSINSPEFFSINKRLEFALRHTDLHHFDDTSFVERKEEHIPNKNSLSIAGGFNSPWQVNINSLKNKLEEIL
jgi:capsular polysaccharide biosynthesis protein